MDDLTPNLGTPDNTQPEGRWGTLHFVATDRRVHLTLREYVLGRAADCDVIIEKNECSKRHCRISLLQSPSQGLPGVPQVTDFSTNGTFLNGLRLHKDTPAMLHNGDLLEIRTGTRFIFSANSQEPYFEQVGRDPDHETVTNNFFFCRFLGAGTYSHVYSVVCRTTGRKFACKVINKVRAGLDYVSSQEILDANPELNVMLKVSHPNIITVHACRQTSMCVYLFLQLVAGGELFDYLQEKVYIAEEECKFIVYQILLALVHLHTNSITHRDIKPENILLEQRRPYSKILLGDFGLAKFSNQHMTTICGTLNYLAPEVLDSEEYTSAVDCWSLGVMMFFLLSGTLPFDAKTEDELKSSIKKASFVFASRAFANVSSACRDFVQRLLQRDPQNRLSAEDALSHPWIAINHAHIQEMYRRL